MLAIAKTPKSRPWINLSGQRFGRLTVLVRTANRGASRGCVFLCRCDCGKEKHIRGASLTDGTIRSCGCLLRDSHRTHGMTKTPEYGCYHQMISRCRNTKHAAYKHYGARGIKVCERWNSFDLFLADMGRRPSSRHSIDRIDNNKGYEPTNCRWATRDEQARNRRSNVLVVFNGRPMTVVEAARESGLDQNLISFRRRNGWANDDLFLAPDKRRSLTRRNNPLTKSQNYRR